VSRTLGLLSGQHPGGGQHPDVFALAAVQGALRNVLRMTLAGCLVAVLAGCYSSTTKPPAGTPTTPKTEPVAASNKEKIVGVWEVTKAAEAPPGATIEFTKDGKLIQTAKVEGKEMKMEGTYSVEGDKITSTTKGPGGKEAKETATITKLTDTELVTKDEKGKTDEFKKKK
jgi:uncharacterized protein (TIGR03066 family)